MKLTVIGLPLPQGSKSARVVRGRAILTDGFGDKPRKLSDWRMAIAACGRLWCQQNGMPAPLDGPVELHVTFFLPRPKSAPKRVQYPATKPDLDKLTRAVGDALAKVAYTEDSRIVDIHVCKRFAIDSPPRAEIEVREAA